MQETVPHEEWKLEPRLKGRYVEAVGRRKTAVARVRITESAARTPVFSVNGKAMRDYFPTDEMRAIATEALRMFGALKVFDVSAHIRGGGIHSHVEALRLGLSRALVLYEAGLRGPLKKKGLLSRDQRMKERRKFGKKKARKAPQWSKR
ncbi:MAG: 30S ribosomal protein S9 [Parcubacteria group bacterium]|nr:30S ribosomal protein S9 [Parcubacteria group bacterium]